MSIKHTLPLFFNLLFITNVWAQIEITMPDPPELPCVPATTCLTAIFDTSRDYLNITSDLENYQIQVFDNLGRLIREVSYSYDGKMDLSDVTPGLYFVIINDSQSKRTEKLIIQQ